MTDQTNYPPRTESKTRIKTFRNISTDIFPESATLIDFWADVIEGEATKEPKFRAAFQQLFDAREPQYTKMQERQITRKHTLYYTTIQSQFAKAVVLSQERGVDLYVSWRLYHEKGISWVKTLLWLVVCVVIGYLLARGRYWFTVGEWLAYSIGTIFVTAFLILLFGSMFRGNPLALLSASLDEFRVDEITSFGLSLHKTMLAAANQVGIDTAKLPTKEPIFQNRKRRL